MIIIGITMISLGSRWLIVEEPWMLDKVANIERLEMTFDELFEPNINSTLPGYLRQIYRFFGLWVLIIGLFISSLSLSIKAIKEKQIVSKIIYIVGFMLIFGMYLGYTLIPSSHFIILMWGLIALYLISFYSYIKLNVK